MKPEALLRQIIRMEIAMLEMRPPASRSERDRRRIVRLIERLGGGAEPCT